MKRQPFELWEQTPPQVRAVVLDFAWSHQRLWQLPLVAQPVAVAELAWQLELPLWSWQDQPFAVSPLEVAAHPQRYAQQYARTLASEAGGYPLHLLQRASGQLTVLDGTHRLLAAYLRQATYVEACVVPWAWLDRIAITQDEV